MDVGLLLLRLTIGLTIAAHGPAKLFERFGMGADKTGAAFEQLGFRPGRRYALAAGITEVAAGVLLALGFLTPVAVTLVASLMLVAAISVHARNGFFVTSGGYEYNVVLGVGALSLAFSGPGALSVDALLGLAPTGWLWGLGAFAAAVGGAAVQLAMRRPAATPLG